jgi:hypothetical protein
MLHSRTLVKDSRRHLLRIRFSLPDGRQPDLDRVLIERSSSSSSSSLSTTLCLQCVPTVKSPSPFPCQEDIPTYWSPSGQSGTVSTSSSSSQFAKVIGTYAEDNDKQRKLFARSILSSGVLSSNTRCANFFSSGMLYRSSEIIGELLRDCGATNLPLGMSSFCSTRTNNLHHSSIYFSCS